MYWIDYCKRMFSVNIEPPKSDLYNEVIYGGLNITGSNIFFMTSSEDPWQYAAMTKLHNPRE